MAPAFRGPGKPLHVFFSPDGRRLAASFGNDPMENGSRVGVFDTETGTPIVELNFPADANDAMRFAPDGQRLVITLSSEETIHDMPAPTGPAPKWLPELARVVAGRELDSAGTVVHIPEVSKRREALATKLVSEPDSPVKRVATWLLAPPVERSISPLSQQSYRTQIESEITNWKTSIQTEIEESPSNFTIAVLSALEQAGRLRARTFGDSSLLSPLEQQCEQLREKMLVYLSGGVARLEKKPDKEDLSVTASNLRRLQHAQPDNLPFAARVQALLARIVAVRGHYDKSVPPRANSR